MPRLSQSRQEASGSQQAVERRQGIYWLLTLPQHVFTPFCPEGVAYIKGQLECGEGTGYVHWQVLCVFRKKASLSAVKRLFGDGCHAELSRSSASDDYVFKEDTRVDGTQFELGVKPFRRNSPTDWGAVRAAATANDLSAVPDDIYIRCFHQLQSIGRSNGRAYPRTTSVTVYWGPTHTGKSYKAWECCGVDPYIKDPTEKWWDLYRGELSCFLDEFRGGIPISCALRWFGIYACYVQIKGGYVPLRVNNFQVTSNKHPRDWWPNEDEETVTAVLRRMNIIHMTLRVAAE